MRIIVKKLHDIFTGNSLLKDELTTTKGQVHEYLQMMNSFKKEGEVQITSNVWSNRKLTNQFPEDMKEDKKISAGD